MQPTHRVSLTSALITLLTIPILAADLSIVIPPTPPFFDNAASLPPSTHATLLSSSHNSSSSHKSLRTAHISRSNTITFSDLPSGSYLLDIFSHNYIFLPFRLDVADSHNSQVISEQLAVEENGQIYADQNLKKARDTRQTLEIYQTFRGNEWDNRGPKLASGVDSLNVNVHPVSRRHFFQKRSAGFDVLSFFKSPMILMGLVTCGLVFGMPYLMENMDPEMKAEMEEMQKKTLAGPSGAGSQLQNFDLASWMAGKTTTEQESSDVTKVGKDERGKR